MQSHVSRSRRGAGAGRLLAALALLISFCTTLVAGVVAIAAPAGAVTCDTWTNSSGGSWDTNANWSGGAPPSGTTPACITAPGTYTVTVGNETISAGALTVGGTGSSPTVAIGNSGSGEPNLTFASVDNAGTIEPGFGGTFTVPGTFTNMGTLDVPTSAFGGSTLNLSALSNQGAFQINETSVLSLPTSSATFTNASTGTLSVATGQTLSVTSPSGQTGTVTQDGVIDNSGTIIVQDALVVQGGSVCGNSPRVGADAQSTSIASSLAFASTVTAGPSCGTGIATDNLFMANFNGTLSGSIPKAYTVAVGDGGAGFAHITIPSAMTISGTLDVGFEGSLSSNAAITNKGTFDAVSSGFPGETLTLSSFTNAGTFDVDTPTTYSLPKKTSTLVNQTSGTISVSSGSGHTLSISSPSGIVGASVTQDGVINNAGAITVQDALIVQGGSICGNTVHVGVDGQSTSIPSSLTFASTVPAGPSCGTGVTPDTLFMANIVGTLAGSIPKGYTVVIGDGGASFGNITATTAKNSGILEPGFGATVSFPKLKNKGIFVVPASSFTTHINLAGNFTNKKVVALNANTQITFASGASLVNSAPTASVMDTGSPVQIVSGNFTNDGILSITAGGTFGVAGIYTQASSGTYLPGLASTSSFGVLNVTSTAALAGAVAPQPAPGFTPPHGSTYLVLESGGLGGTQFTTVTGAFTQQVLAADNIQVTAN